MLAVSEMFYSLQGEGPSMGRTSIFLRLKGCNLSCGGKHTIRSGKLDSGATWRCDSIESWIQGEQLSFESIINFWFQQKWNLAEQLIITGGEPLLQSVALTEFIPKVKEKLTHIKIEIESNGTVLPPDTWESKTLYFNISPKLCNSGMPKNKRIQAECINYFKEYPRSIFKFVLSSIQDYEEIKTTYIDVFKIPPSKIWLMPAADNRERLQELSKDIAELALKHHHSFSHRLHIYLWDQKTGV